MSRRGRWPHVVWLTLVWVMLWGSAAPATVLGGVLVAVLVTAAFPLPVMPEQLPVRPRQLLYLVAYLAYDLVVSGVAVSWETVRHGPRATAGIVAVPLLTGSGRVAAVVANAVSLAPGTFVLQIDHRHEVCYVYTLGMRGPADAPRIRREVLGLQRRVIRALGTRDEIAAVDAALVAERKAGAR